MTGLNQQARVMAAVRSVTVRDLALRALDYDRLAQEAATSGGEYAALDAAAIDARETFLASLRQCAGIEPELFNRMVREGFFV